MRERNELIWLDNVLQDISCNDYMFTDQVYMNMYDTPHNSYDFGKVSDNIQHYKVIDSMTLKNNQEHRDKQTCTPRPWKFEGHDWMRADKFKWIPPDPDSFEGEYIKEGVTETAKRIHSIVFESEDLKKVHLGHGSIVAALKE